MYVKIAVVANHERYHSVFQELTNELEHEVYWIDKKEDLQKERLLEMNPRYVFFLHWSYIIPSEIYNHFESVIFHMTDVPFGRGGSPLQNLISRGIYETKITALKCEEDLDAGPVYMKKPLSLFGNAEEIYVRAAKTIKDMIINIIEHQPTPIKQEGEPVLFQRRKPKDGDISQLKTIEQVFDYIRMLDADGYPKAFIEIGEFRLEFERCSLKPDHIHADVKIRKRKDVT